MGFIGTLAGYLFFGWNAAAFVVGAPAWCDDTKKHWIKYKAHRHITTAATNIGYAARDFSAGTLPQHWYGHLARLGFHIVAAIGKALIRITPLVAMMWFYGTKTMWGWTGGRLYFRFKDRHAKASKRGSAYQ
jgi:hypothetical protein